MSVAAIGGAAVLLVVERAVYAVIARAPGAFLALCARLAPAARGGPIAIVARLFYAFKVLQIMVFAAWCLVYGNGSLAPARQGPIVLGGAAALVVVGQILVVATFDLGRLPGAPIPARRLVRAAGRRDRVLCGGDLPRVAAPVRSGLAEENRADVGLGARPSIIRVDRD